MKDVISMRDFSKEEILFILDTADEVKHAIHDKEYDNNTFKKKHNLSVKQLLNDTDIATLFLEKSTRTNYSFRSAATKAGAKVEGFTNPEDTSLGKGETWAATIEMFAGWGYNALVMRTTTEGIPRWSKQAIHKNHQHVKQQHDSLHQPYSYHPPIILNGGDGTNQHPTQCFLDLMTIREIARSQNQDLDNLNIALLNDLRYGRTNASLMSIAHHFNWKLHLAYPPRFGPQQSRLDDLINNNVQVIDHGTDFMEAMTASLIAYQSRPQKERVAKGEDLITIANLGRITLKMYEQMGNLAPYLLHPLPIDSKTFEEISHDLQHHPKNFTKFQAENGIYIRIALLAIGLDKIISPYTQQEQNHTHTTTTITQLPFSQKEKPLNNLRSGIIEHEGIVLDHIPAGYARRLAGILGLEQQNLPLVISSYLTTPNGRQSHKDIIKIHTQYQFTQQQYEAISLIAPQTTISLISNGNVYQKIRPTLGTIITNRITCGNDQCVTNIKEEHVTPLHLVEQNTTASYLRCDYCEQPDTIDKIYDDKRFKYIGEEK